MTRFSLSVPDDQAEIRTLMEAGWQLEASFGEEARMVPPPELANLMGFRDFVRDIERHAVEIATRDLRAALTEARNQLIQDVDPDAVIAYIDDALAAPRDYIR